MRIRLGLLLCLLMVNGAHAQTMGGSNYGTIPDGTATGPNQYGAPRDIYFTSNSVGTVQSIGLTF